MAAGMLVVDDEEEICDFLKDFFEQEGLAVVLAHRGEEVFEKIRQEVPAICLLDINLPGINGLEVLRQIKHNYPVIKVIMLTGHETSDKIQEALKCGADHYLNKPFSIQLLKEEVFKQIGKAA